MRTTGDSDREACLDATGLPTGADRRIFPIRHTALQLTAAQLTMANETTLSRKNEAEVNFVDTIMNAM